MQPLKVKVAGIIFLIIALAHLARLSLGTVAILGTHVIPVWASGIGFAVSALMAMWMFRKY